MAACDFGGGIEPEEMGLIHVLVDKQSFQRSLKRVILPVQPPNTYMSLSKRRAE